MAKSYLITTIIPVFFAIQGAFLIIYGLVTGASIIDIVFAFAVSGDISFVALKEMYVIIGIVRILSAIVEMKSVKTRAGMIVTGIFFVSSSIVGVFYGIAIGGINASNIYGIAIDFIVMFALSLFYLIYAFKQVQS